VKIILILLVSLIFGLGLTFLYFNFQTGPKTISYTIPTPTPAQFEFLLDQPPKDSLIGEISSPSGQIDWQSRTATTAAALTATTAIQQGESLITKSKSSVSVTFSDTVLINIFADSDLTFAQTLPVNLLISQTRGSARYQPSGTIPVSVRTLHLLTNIGGGDVIITLDPKLPFVYLDIYQGSVTLGFNNLQFISQRTDISSGRRVVYNDVTRKLILKKLPPKV